MRQYVTVAAALLLILAAFAAIMAILLGVEGNPFDRYLEEVTGRAECSAAVQFLAATPDEAYRTRIRADVEAINAYWAAAYPTLFNVDYTRPCLVQEYVPTDFLYADECRLDNQAQAGGNAFYCGRMDGIFWDGPTFFHPIYHDVGPTALTIILAHEWGHYIQDRSGQYPEAPLDVELQADCYAGAYLGWAVAQGKIPVTDIEQVIAVMATFGQPRYAAIWGQRTYGSADQRNRAVRMGALQGPAACDIDFANRFGNPNAPTPGGNRPRPR